MNYGYDGGGGNYTDRLSDYVDVATRIAEFREKYPEGSLQPADPQRPYTIERVTGWENYGTKQQPDFREVTRTFVVYVAAAYRAQDDARPGIGAAWEPYPGRTPYTRDSELQNAETSAWGRAIVAALAAEMRTGIATSEEIRNRRAGEENQDPPPQDPLSAARSRLAAEADGQGISLADVSEKFKATMEVEITSASIEQVQEFTRKLKAGEVK